jgi:hypothetical protein
MLRLFSNYTKLKLTKSLKHNFSILQNNKISEKLSYMNSEEDMRKYFNIVDWDKKVLEDKLFSNLKREQNEYSEKAKSYNNLTREDIYKIYKELKNDLERTEETKRKFDTKFELKNQFWLEDIDFLKDKPRNYLLITGLNGNDVNDIVNLCKYYGRISTYYPIRDLSGKLSMIEIYYESDEDAKKARHQLNEYEYENTVLLAKNYMDQHFNDVNNRTLVIEKLDREVTQNQVLKELSVYGDILRVEMPLEEKNRQDKLEEFSDSFFRSLGENKDKVKNSAYLIQVNRLINNFKKAMVDENINDDGLLNNLLLNVKFYLKKFFPQEYVNNYIHKELEKIDTIRKNPLQDHKVKISNAYEKLISNLENLIAKYEEKMRKLGQPISVNDVIVDMYGNDFDPEKLDRELINKAVDEKIEGVDIKSRITEMEFYATFNPLAEQIAKVNFIRSLTEDEKNILKDKHDIDLNVNVPSFINYFHKFTKAIGIDMIENYLELSQLFVSMSPAEKLYFGKNLAHRKLRPDEFNIQEYLLEYLGIRRYRKFSTPGKIKEITNKHSRHPKIKDKDLYLRTIMNNLFDKLPRLTSQQLTRMLIREGSVYSKLGYLRFSRSINLKKKKDFVTQIRNRISRFNSHINELNSYYKILVSAQPEAKAELDQMMKEVGKYKFVDSQQNIPSEMDFESNYEFEKTEKAEKVKGKSKPMKQSHEKKLNSLDINQIKNRIDLLKIDRSKIVNSINNLMNNKLYKNKYFEVIDEKIQENLLHYVKTVLKDEPKLQSYYIDRVQNNLEKFKYVESMTKGYREHKYTLLELAENIIQKEMEYNLQVDKVKIFIETVEENFGEKVNKANLIQALSAYTFVNNMQQLDYGKLNRTEHGSPVINYFYNVRELFEKEVEKFNSLKDLAINKNEEYSIDEIYNKRKELIENYTNKIAAYEGVINKELNDYKLKELVDDSLDNEIKKKEFEANENRRLFGTQNEEEYKDISYLLNNLNKLGKENNYEKVSLLLKNKKQFNKGYAFVTFSTIEEAKYAYTTAKILGLEFKGKDVKVTPKFDRTHAHFQLEQTIEQAKNDAKIINKRRELEEAERNLNQFEKEWRDKMDKKHSEHNNILTAYKDLFADPFKKHDKYNPFEDDEEDEVRQRIIRQEKLLGIDNSWLFEDDKIDKLRRSKENRLTKKYLDHELLKRGLVPENVLRSDFLQPTIDDMYSDNTEIKMTPEISDDKGRITKQIDKKYFIEKYLGKDGLHQTYTPLTENRDKAISREIKELRERFPKEKFINSPEQSDSLITHVNSTYLRLINDIDTKDAKLDLYDRISPLSPINKKIQAVLNQREEYLENEEQKQMITLENFFQKMTNSLTRTDAKFDNIPENVINEQKKKETFYKTHPELYDLRKLVGEEVEPVPETFDRKKFVKKEAEELEDDFVIKFKFKKETEEAKKTDESTSFKAFLNKRKSTPHKKTTQFDIKGLSKEEVGLAKLEAIREKYNKHITQPMVKKSVYSYIQRKQQPKQDLEKKIQIEKKKAEFIKELEDNFKEELEVLPSFREYFQGLQEGIKTKPATEDTQVEPLQFNYNYRDNLDKLREKLAVLYTGKVDPKTFEEIFVKDQTEFKTKLDNWVTPQDEEYIWKRITCKMGLSREEIVQKADEVFPEIANVENMSEMQEYIKTIKEEEKQRKEINKLEDLNDDEYFFNLDCGQTLEEHLAHLSKLEYKNVTLRSDKDGRIIIRREYKGNYRYDLDEVMKFDISKERMKMLDKLKNFDFEGNLDNSAEFYTQLISYINKNQIMLPIDIDAVIAKSEEVISQQYGLENFSLADLKNCIENLTNMPNDKLKQLISDLKRIIELKIGNESQSYNNELSSIAGFSESLFNEKEIRLLSCFLRELNTDLNKINLEGIKKYIFIQDVLLGSLLSHLKILLKTDIIIIYTILKLLPEANEVNQDTKKAIKYILWDKYKKFMKDNFTIAMKKESQINPSLKQDIEELQRVIDGLKKHDYHNRDDEIKQYSKKLKEYYIELSKTDSSSAFDNIISDEELFIDEISEQVNNRLERLKKKGDLTKPKVNEEALFNRQLDYLNNLDKKYEAMSYNNTGDRDFYDEIKRKKNFNALRREKLVKEGRPVIDYNLPRLL